MLKQDNILAQAGVKFFGKLTASATHEMKNTLSIISGNAGLLEDLSLLPNNKEAIPTERTNDIAKKIATLVERTDNILKNLNRFSHSVDLPAQSIELFETIGFVINISSRLIEQKGFCINIEPPKLKMMVDTNLFYLQNMLWNTIEQACSKNTQDSKIEISFRTDTLKPSIWFSIGSSEEELGNNLLDGILESEEDQVLLAYLGINIEIRAESNSFGLVWS